MRSSTLPTETADSGQPSRTSPTQTPSGIQDEKPTAEQTELETLRRKNEQADADVERLETEVDRLHRQIRTLEQSRQAVVDRYEGVIVELESAETARTEPKPVFDRLRDWLF